MGHSNKYVEKEFEVVGTRFKRPDGIDKVTGKARYGADATAPGVPWLEEFYARHTRMQRY